jgi:hypothetical protein
MKKKTFLLAIATFLSVINLFAQAKVKPPKVRFGKVKKEWVKMKVYPKDSNAHAVVLYDKALASIEKRRSFELVHTRHKIVKVLSKEGYKWGDISLSLYHRNNAVSEKVESFKAYTYNLVDGKVMRTKVTKRDFMEERVSSTQMKKKLALNNIKTGTVIEYRYTIKSRNIFNLRSWNCQDQIPIQWSEYHTNIPDFFRYEILPSGYLPKLVINEKKYTHIDYDITRHFWAVKDVPALKLEKLTGNLYDYVPRLEFWLASVKFPNRKMEPLITNWKDVAFRLKQSHGFGRALNRTGFVNQAIKQIKKENVTHKQMALAIYKYVQNYMKWNGYYSVGCPGGLRKSYTEKTGSTGEINLILLSMLRKVGIKANPVLLSTRGNGKLRVDQPAILPKCNYMIVQAMIEGYPVLMDATEKMIPMGSLPPRCLNGVGRLLDSEGGKWISLYSMQNRVQNNIMLSLEGGVAKANIHIHYHGINAYKERQSLMKHKEEKYTAKRWAKSSCKLQKYEIKNAQNIYQPLITKYEVELEDGVKQMADMIYIPTLLVNDFDDTPFKAKTRKFPIDFGAPFARNYFMSIDIPKGYKVESLPKQKVIALENRGGRFTYMANEKNGKIQVIVRFSIRRPLFASTEYLGLRELYNQAVEKLQEQIVLKKI